MGKRMKPEKQYNINYVYLYIYSAVVVGVVQLMCS